LRTEPAIYILLATCNAGRFLAEQLASLGAQKDDNWRLLVYDDGSTDGTPEILDQKAHDDRRVSIQAPRPERLGSAASFFLLMQQALDQGAQYFALCDQDDVWLPEKLQRQRAAMQELEHAGHGGRPLLCWSDLHWIDSHGRTFAGSHFRRAGAAAALLGPRPWLLAMNAVPGCAMVGNRALLEKALPRPPGVEHHDWWLALVAAACGHVRVLEEPLVGYRQHGGNLIGAASPGTKFLRALGSPAALIARGSTTYWQAVVNATRLRQRCDPEQMSSDWAHASAHTAQELGATSRWRRAAAVLRGPVRRIGIWRNLLMVVCAFAPASIDRRPG
jgi:hypothetical protein